MVFWFNKGLLDEAGVTTDPAAAFEGGTWTRDALDDLLTKVKATGKRGYVHMASYGDLFGLVTALGGTMIEDNKAVFDEDPKAQEIIGWLFDSIANGNISYGGSLPKGQSSDALFLASQLATTHQGRWILPNLKKIKNIQYDIAPYPSEDGKTIGPIVVFTAAMSVNAKAKDQEVAKKFLADYVSADGQRFRLSGRRQRGAVGGRSRRGRHRGQPAGARQVVHRHREGRLRHPDAARPQRDPRRQLGDRRRQADEDPRHGREDVQPDHGQEAQRWGGLIVATSVKEKASSVEVPVEHKKALNRTHRQNALFGYGFMAPQLIGLILFMLGPLIMAVVYAFANYDGFNPMSFAGLDNFVWVFTDPQILTSMGNTLWFTVLQVPGLMISAFLAAYFLQKAGAMKSVYRVFFFAPVVTSSVAVAAIWLLLFNPELSPVNSALASIGITAPDWLQNPATVIPSIAIVSIWQGLGYQMVMFMAGLENVPKSLLEAADIDGASEWQRMRKITIPLLSPTILFLSITGIIGSFQVFDYIYVFFDTTAPAAARTIVYEIVQVAFREFNFGRGAALALVLFLILLAVTGLQLLAQKRWVHYTE